MENQEGEKNSKKYGQKFKTGVIIAALVVLGLSAGYVLGVIGYIKIIGPYVSEMKYKAFLKDYLKPYEEDFVGGNTPEETIDLFIEALKKGNYELASKYFTVEQQKEWYDKFIEMKNEGRGQGLIDELENNKKNWRKEQQGDNQFVIKYNTGAGVDEITNFIVLKKNVNNKWKIGSF